MIGAIVNGTLNGLTDAYSEIGKVKRKNKTTYYMDPHDTIAIGVGKLIRWGVGTTAKGIYHGGKFLGKQASNIAMKGAEKVNNILATPSAPQAQIALA